MAYLFSSQITLRILLLMGTSLYLLYYFVAADQPLWPAIFGTACIGATPIFGLLRAIVTFEQPTEMTRQGQVPTSVFFTLDGDVDVNKADVSFQSPPFSWIGEISIIGGFPASATVRSKPGTKAVVWDRQHLMPKLKRNEKFRIAVEALFARDMAVKLAQAANFRKPSWQRCWVSRGRPSIKIRCSWRGRV